MCLGPMSNIIYIIADTGSKKCMVIDPAWDVKKIVHFLEANGFELSSILLTHGHSDHCNGVMRYWIIDWSRFICHNRNRQI
jgi:glyoxylase-like metal-dependent hydrolase (beta-lactamase superfamily II)